MAMHVHRMHIPCWYLAVCLIPLSTAGVTLSGVEDAKKDKDTVTKVYSTRTRKGVKSGTGKASLLVGSSDSCKSQKVGGSVTGEYLIHVLQQIVC